MQPPEPPAAPAAPAAPGTQGQRAASDAKARLAELEVVFAALAHAARRQVLLVVWFRGGTMSAGDIAGRFSHTWPTTSRHLRVLEDAGLLAHERQGRTRIYRVNQSKLDVVRAWLRWFDAPTTPRIEEETTMPTISNIQRNGAALRDIAMSYPGAHEDFPWGETAVKVKGKAFLFMHMGAELSLSCKLPASHEMALMLPFAKPTGYGLGKSGWVSARFGPDQDPPLDLLREWIDESYRAVAPKKLVAALAGEGRNAEAAPAEPSTSKASAKKTSGSASKARATKTSGTASKASATKTTGTASKANARAAASKPASGSASKARATKAASKPASGSASKARATKAASKPASGSASKARATKAASAPATRRK